MCLHPGLPGLRLPTLLLLATLALPAAAQTADTDHEWCDRGTYSRDGDDRVVYCEVRTVTMAPPRTVRANAEPNGGIRVEGWDRDVVQVEARVRARGRSNAAAKVLADRVTIETRGTIRADLPDARRGQWAAVSFRLQVPRQSNLDLETHNGGITIEDVAGTIRFEAHNGGVTLDGLGGDVQGHTLNGGLDVRLTGRQWIGQGLDVSTTNGGVDLDIPRDYSAEVDTGTTNGRVRHKLTTSGLSRRSQQRLRLTLGDGGPLVRVTTTNGGVSIDHH